MTPRIVGLLVTGALLLAACGSGLAGTPLDASGDRLIDLESFGLSRDDERVLHNAEQEYVRRCAAAAGFQFIPTPYEAVEGTAWPVFGSDDVETARVEGYQVQDMLMESPDPEDGNRAILESLSAEQQEQWSLVVTGDPDDSIDVAVDGGVVGTPRTGCISEARQVLYGDLATYLELSFLSLNLSTRIRDAVQTDPRFIAAEAGWSSCMRSKGWEVSTQTDALLVVFHAYDTQGSDDAHALELNIATDDATCARESRSVDEGQQAMARASQQMIGDLEGQLLAYQELRLDALDAARAILEGG